MTNLEITDRVKQWQQCTLVRPLTCGNNSRHRRLEPKEVSHKVVLVCPDCNYFQNHIPSLVLDPDHLKILRETFGMGGC